MMMTTTGTAAATPTNKTKNYYNIRVYIPQGQWNKEAVFIEDQIDKFRPMWVPRNQIRETTLLKKRNFDGEVHFIYNLEIETEWWHQNVNFGRQTLPGKNGHRRGLRSDD